MSKRVRQRSRGSSQSSSNGGEVDELGHTPKWVRSSPSISPEPYIDPGSTAAKDEVTGNQEMQCILPGHPPLVLASAAEYEAHYARDHTNQCIACKANLPSPWMLKLHHEENHDPLISAKRDAGEKTYQCFLQDCEKVTLTAQKRRFHLIDKHGFPKNYHFTLIDSGLRGKGSLLEENKSPSKESKEALNAKAVAHTDTASNKIPQHTAAHAHDASRPEPIEKQPHKAAISSSKSASVPTENQDKSSGQEDAGLDNLNKAMSSLVFVPMSVRRKNKKTG